MLLSTGPPFCLHILHCPSKGLSRNWADFWNLKLEYLTNYWSDLSEINCNGFSFKSPLIWYTSFNQRHRAIFGCCIATTILNFFGILSSCIISVTWLLCNMDKIMGHNHCKQGLGAFKLLKCERARGTPLGSLPLVFFKGKPQKLVTAMHGSCNVSTQFCVIFMLTATCIFPIFNVTHLCLHVRFFFSLALF